MSIDDSDSRIGIFTTDRELVIRSWDDWLERVTGISAGEACGRRLDELFPELGKQTLISRFKTVIEDGSFAVLASAFHQYLIPCPTRGPSKYFSKMRQHTTIAPLHEGTRIIGTLVTIEDVTGRLERERELKEQLESSDEEIRLQAAEALVAGEMREPVQPLMHLLRHDSSWRVRRAAVSGLAARRGPDSITVLLRALQKEHRNPSVLNSALQVLSMMDLDTLTPLTGFLRDPDAELRTYAALALGEMRDERAVPDLIRATADPDPNVRYHAIEALGKMRAEEALDALCSIAGSRDFFVAFPALDALARIGNPRACPRIAPLLEDAMLREAAVEALGSLGDQCAVTPVAEQLNRPDAPVEIILQAIAAIHDRYERLYGEGAHVIDIAHRAIKPAGSLNLIDAMNGVASENLRPLALILGRLEGSAVERALVRLLGQPSVRKEATEALVRYGSRITELLMEHLEAEDIETRKAAVFALGRIGDARAVPSLIGVLGVDDELTAAASGALAMIGDQRAFEPLIDLLSHSNMAVRHSAVAALNSLGNPEMGRRMEASLLDPDPRVRESAVKIAGYFGYSNCKDLLFECCRDADEKIRSIAVEHIAYLDDERVLPALAQALGGDEPGVRSAAARALSQAECADALPLLHGALDDGEAWVRYFVIRSIGMLVYSDACRSRIMEAGAFGEGSTFDALARIARRDPAGQVRIAAVETLGRIGGGEAVGILSSFIGESDHDLVRTALAALGRIPDADALPYILDALLSPDGVKRLDAIEALRDRGSKESIEALRTVAAQDGNAHIMSAAVAALGSLSAPEAVAALIELTADASRRESCIEALSRLGDAYVEDVARGLNHQAPEVRSATAKALARMKHPAATAKMMQALGDEDASVRLSAVIALGHFGSRRVEPGLVEILRSDPDIDVRHAAREALRLL